MEFPCRVSDSKVAVVLGHDNYGAVFAGINRPAVGIITKMLTRIDPAVASLTHYPTQKPSDESKSLAKAIDHNVLMTIFQIRKIQCNYENDDRERRHHHFGWCLRDEGWQSHVPFDRANGSTWQTALFDFQLGTPGVPRTDLFELPSQAE